MTKTEPLHLMDESPGEMSAANATMGDRGGTIDQVRVCILTQVRSL